MSLLAAAIVTRSEITIQRAPIEFLEIEELRDKPVDPDLLDDAAHLRDGAAMVEFLCWLDKAAPKGGLTEIDVVTALEGYRRATNALHDISFDTICGAGPNGAIMHYRVTHETNRPVGRDELLLVDSGAQFTDGTTDIAKRLGAEIHTHPFVNQAKQFQWALDTLTIRGDWVLRLDADEIIEPDLAREIADQLPLLPAEVVGVNLKRKHIFMDRWVRHGGRYPLVMLRLWRHGHGRILLHGASAAALHLVDTGLLRPDPA